MKKIAYLLPLLTIGFNCFAQRVDPTFTWANKSDYQINGETAVTFKPGEAVNFTINYTLGSTDGTLDVLNFILFGAQDEPEANKDVLGAGWANFTIGCTENTCNNYVFPGGSGGVATATYNVVNTATLNSADPNLTYRILTYMAYTPDGGSITYGGPGASDPTLVYIRSQEEIDALLSSNYNKIKLNGYYNRSLHSIIVNENISGDYSIYNLLGQSVQQGEISREISVNALKSGLYILSTESGLLKFAK